MTAAALVAHDAALAVLRRSDASMAEVMAALTTLDRSDAPGRTHTVGIASNITLDLLGTYVRRYAYVAGVRVELLNGSYDDVLGDVQRFVAAGVDTVLIAPFFDNLQPAWESQLPALDATARHAPVADYLARLELALIHAQGVGTVLLAGSHPWHSQTAALADGVVAAAVHDFNAALHAMAHRHANVRYLDTQSLLMQVGAAQALDARFYHRSKAPYRAAFLNAWARQIDAATRSFGSVFYKVLVLDCDNTLWGGIVGEEGALGVALDPYNYPGNVYWAVQQMVRTLEQHGTLLCLCSKNNPQDVQDVLDTNPHMVLRDAHIVARQVNWDDKPSNLRRLAQALNVGLESMVFVDDSAFEISAVREQLPQVRTFQVPARLTDYPAVIQEISALLMAGGVSAESRAKTLQYRVVAQAQAEQAQFASHEDYLRSLQLRVRLYRNAREQVTRIVELVNKSNQFNMTTQRLQAGEVQRLMDSPTATVYSFAVHDRLADHGITGVLITDDAPDAPDAVQVHSFLMSCRVLGRGVEFSVWNAVRNDARSRGKRMLHAAYLPTAKNAQALDFFDRLGFTRTDDGGGDGSRHYQAEVDTVHFPDSNWVELNDG
jgi:FkbH-like protein